MLLAGPEAYSSDDGSLTFSFTRVLGPGTTESFFVVYSIAAGAPGGVDFSASLAANADVTAIGQTSGLAPTVLGAPVPGGTLTVTAGSTSTRSSGGCSFEGGGEAGGALLSWIFLACTFLAVLCVLRRRTVRA
jgi:hypothetical protein